MMLTTKNVIAINSKYLLLSNFRVNEHVIMRLLGSKRFVSNTINEIKSANDTSSSVQSETKNRQQHHSNNLKLDLKFENREIAFISKSTLEVLRGLIVFQICSIKPLVDNQNKVKPLNLI